jgi:hypothetical protein
MRQFQYGPCRINENRRLILPRTSCLNYSNFADISNVLYCFKTAWSRKRFIILKSKNIFRLSQWEYGLLYTVFYRCSTAITGSNLTWRIDNFFCVTFLLRRNWRSGDAPGSYSEGGGFESLQGQLLYWVLLLFSTVPPGKFQYLD